MKKFIVILILLMAAAYGGYWYIEQQSFNGTASPSNVTQNFEVKEGEGSTEVGENLEKSGLVKSKYFFYYYTWKTRTSSKIQVGVYDLAPNMKISDMVAKFTTGDIVVLTRRLTVPEGFTNKKIIERLRETKPEMADEFEQLVNCKCLNQEGCACDKFSSRFTFLQEIPKGVDMEGYLFPDTYFIEKDDTAEILVAKFLNNFQRQVNSDILQEVATQGKTLHQVITMASIIEREVNTPQDRRIVSDIFWKRHNDNHPLQSCATLAYFLGVDKKKFYNEDIQTDSPYNTYINAGLPPGPVSNPGLDTIRATVYPTPTEYYFFLTDLNTGEMVYSRTGEEHEENKTKHGL